MSSPADLARARQRGEYAATEVLVNLEVDQTDTIDVYSIIESHGIWLMFGELTNALGFFVRKGDTAGIYVNHKRPRSVQRVTAAHEFGHFVLGHQWSVDGIEEIDGSTREIQEVEAQAFALDFIMPLTLAEIVSDELGLPESLESVDAHQIYLLATRIGISYRACLVQLRRMEKLSRPRAQELLRYRPKDLKRLIGDGVGPVDPWADIWPLEASESGRTLEIRARDEVRLTLPENPNTGYRWILREGDRREELVQIVSDQFEELPQAQGQIGAGGHRFLSFRVMEPSELQVWFDLQRSWVSGGSIDSFHVNLEIGDNEAGGEAAGFRNGVKSKLSATG